MVDVLKIKVYLLSVRVSQGGYNEAFYSNTKIEEILSRYLPLFDGFFRAKDGFIPVLDYTGSMVAARNNEIAIFFRNS